MEIEIGWRARKWGVADEDMLHALRLSMVTLFTRDDVTMILDPARDGQILEVGSATWTMSRSSSRSCPCGATSRGSSDEG